LVADWCKIYLPVTYALNTFGLAFATISSLFVWVVLEKWASIKTIPSAFVKWQVRTRDSEDKVESLEIHERGSEPTPTWWYLIALGVSLGLGIFACEYYPVQLRWYGVLLAMVVSAVFFIPVSLSHNLQHCKPNSDIDLAVLGLCDN
jgi:hypothetical protein